MALLQECGWARRASPAGPVEGLTPIQTDSHVSGRLALPVPINGVEAKRVHVDTSLATHVHNARLDRLAGGGVGDLEALAALVLAHGTQTVVIAVGGPGVL